MVDNFIDMEIERRKGKVSGYQRFKSFAGRAGSKTIDVVGRAGRGTVSAVRTLDKAHSDLQAYRLKKINERVKINRAKAKLEKARSSRSKSVSKRGGPLSSFGGDSPFSLNKE